MMHPSSRVYSNFIGLPVLCFLSGDPTSQGLWLGCPLLLLMAKSLCGVAYLVMQEAGEGV